MEKSVKMEKSMKNGKIHENEKSVKTENSHFHEILRRPLYFDDFFYLNVLI